MSARALEPGVDRRGALALVAEHRDQRERRQPLGVPCGEGQGTTARVDDDAEREISGGRVDRAADARLDGAGRADEEERAALDSRDPLVHGAAVVEDRDRFRALRPHDLHQRKWFDGRRDRRRHPRCERARGDERAAAVTRDDVRARWFERIDEHLDHLLSTRPTRDRAARDDARRRAGRIRDEPCAPCLGEDMRDRLARERHLQQQRERGAGHRTGPARSIEDAVEERRRIDRAGYPAPHPIETGAPHDAVRRGADAHVRMGREEHALRSGVDDRGRAAAHVDDRRRATCLRRERARRRLDRLIAQDDVRARAA